MREVHPIAGVGAAVLAGSPLPADGIRLREICAHGNLKLREASDCSEASALLRDESDPVLLCERKHADGNREDPLNITTSLPAPSNLIVFSRLAGEYRWKGAESRRFRRADDAIRAREVLANRLRCLEPLGVRLC
jgi:hypothetical protein